MEAIRGNILNDEFMIIYPYLFPHYLASVFICQNSSYKSTESNVNIIPNLSSNRHEVNYAS